MQVVMAGQKSGNPSCIRASDIQSSSPVANDPRPIYRNQPMSNSPRYPGPHRSAQKSKSSSSRLHKCLIPGCSKYFTRTDYRCNHLKRKHHLPIPKGCWAHTWVSRMENYHYCLAATIEQELENDILLLNASAEGNG